MEYFSLDRLTAVQLGADPAKYILSVAVNPLHDARRDYASFCATYTGHNMNGAPNVIKNVQKGAGKLEKSMHGTTLHDFWNHFQELETLRQARRAFVAGTSEMTSVTKCLDAVISTLFRDSNKSGLSLQLVAMFYTAKIFSVLMDAEFEQPVQLFGNVDISGPVLGGMQATHKHILSLAEQHGCARPVSFAWPTAEGLFADMLAHSPQTTPAVPATLNIQTPTEPDWIQPKDMLCWRDPLSVTTCLSPGNSRYSQINLTCAVPVDIAHDTIVTQSMRFIPECIGAELFTVPGDGCCTARVMGALHLINTGQITSDSKLAAALSNSRASRTLVAEAAHASLELAESQGNPLRLETTKLQNLINKLRQAATPSATEAEYADALSMAMHAKTFLVKLNLTTNAEDPRERVPNAGSVDLNIFLSEHASNWRVPMGVVYTSKNGRKGHTSLIVGRSIPEVEVEVEEEE